MSSSLAALDLLPKGVLLIDAHGAVSFANKAAQKMLDRQDGLTLRPVVRNKPPQLGYLTSSRGTQAALDEAIRASVSRDLHNTPHFNQSLAIPRQSGNSYVLHFSALPALNEWGMAGDMHRAIVFVSDGQASWQPDEDLLRLNYGLSTSEIRVVQLVINGGGVSGMADQLGVSPNTVKTHLKSLYAKTGVSDRAALVKLLFLLSA